MQMNITRLRNRIYKSITFLLNKKYDWERMREAAFEYALQRHLELETEGTNSTVEFTGLWGVNVEAENYDVSALIQKTLNGDFDTDIIALLVEDYNLRLAEEEADQEWLKIKLNSLEDDYDSEFWEYETHS